MYIYTVYSFLFTVIDLSSFLGIENVIHILFITIHQVIWHDDFFHRPALTSIVVLTHTQLCDTSLKSSEGFVCARMNIENLVKPGDLEDFEYLRIDVAQLKLPLGLLHLFLERDKHAQGSAGKMLYVSEAQQHLHPWSRLHKVR